VASIWVLPSLPFKFSFHASLAVIYYRKQWCWCRSKCEAPMSLTSAIRDWRWSSSASGCKVRNEISPINRQNSASSWDNQDDSWAKNINLRRIQQTQSNVAKRSEAEKLVTSGANADMRRKERRTLTLNNVAWCRMVVLLNQVTEENFPVNGRSRDAEKTWTSRITKEIIRGRKILIHERHRDCLRMRWNHWPWS